MAHILGPIACSNCGHTLTSWNCGTCSELYGGSVMAVILDPPGAYCDQMCQEFAEEKADQAAYVLGGNHGDVL